MILDRLLNRGVGLAAGTPAADDDFWYTPPTEVSSGINVTPDTAMRVAVVWACVRVLAETVASLPLLIYRRLPDGGKERAPDYPLYAILHDAPNIYQTSFEWREMMMGHLALRGNAYNWVKHGSDGAIEKMIPLHPDRVRVKRLSDDTLQYRIQPQNSGVFYLAQSEVFHLRGLSSDGKVGLSPMQMEAESVGLAIATEQYGSRLFKNRVMVGGVFEHPGPGGLSDKAYGRLKSSLAEKAGLERSHEDLILEEGIKYHNLGLTNEEAQFLETRKYQLAEIARIFRVPPHLIGDLEKATFSNIEQQSLDFVIHTIRPWLIRWEQAITRDLILPADRAEYFAEFLVDGLLRGDSAARSAYYREQFMIGALSQNEIRALENRNSIGPDGDRYYVPLNMKPYDEPVAEPQSFNTGDVGAVELEPEPDTANSSDTGGGSDAPWVQPLVEDVAARLANAEISKLEKRVDKAAVDRPRFNAWLKEFYEAHGEYVAKAIAPLARAWESVEGQRFDESIMFGLANMPLAALSAGDPVATVAQWKTERAEQIERTLFEGLCYDLPKHS